MKFEFFLAKEFRQKVNCCQYSQTTPFPIGILLQLLFSLFVHSAALPVFDLVAHENLSSCKNKDILRFLHKKTVVLCAYTYYCVYQAGMFKPS